MPPREETIKVMIRIKPTSGSDLDQSSFNPNEIRCGSKIYSFDHVFNSHSSNQQVFEKVGLQLVVNAFEGYNATLFVYGQTGTGKTHTMSGSINEEGLIQKCVNSMKKTLENQFRYQFYSLKMSYIEIYNQTVKDLLSNSEKVIRQNPKEDFYVDGVSEVFIQNNDDFLKNFNKGTQNRFTKPTQMNLKSSRSHSIVTLILETKEIVSGKPLIKTSKLNFVDLAGSEKLKQSGVSGNRKIETANINLSLGTLKKVISALEKKKQKNVIHIPYRESMLTKILKDSLGGNSHTIIIGTINDSSQFLSQTISTLNFLESAKHVKNTTRVNEKIQGNEEQLQNELLRYQLQNKHLEEELLIARKHLEDAKIKESGSLIEINELKQRILDFQSHSNQFQDQEFFSVDNNYFWQPQEEDFNFEIEPNLNILSSIQEEDQTRLEESEQSIPSSKEQIKSQSVHPSNIFLKQNKINNYSKVKESSPDILQSYRIQYLEEKIARLTKDEDIYDHLLRIVQNNIENLKFTEAQLSIFRLQKEELQRTKENLTKEQKHSHDLMKSLEELKKKNKNLKSLDLDNISQTSQWKNSVQVADQKIKQMEEKMEKIKTTYQIEMFKVTQLLEEERKKRSNAEESQIMIRKQYENLEQIYELQKEKQFKQMKEAFKIEKDTMLQLTNEEKQQTISRYVKQWQQFFNICTKDFQDVQQQIELKYEEINLLKNQNMNLLVKIEQLTKKSRENDDQLDGLRFSTFLSERQLRNQKEQFQVHLRQLRQEVQQMRGQKERLQLYQEDLIQKEIFCKQVKQRMNDYDQLKDQKNRLERKVKSCEIIMIETSIALKNQAEQNWRRIETQQKNIVPKQFFNQLQLQQETLQKEQIIKNLKNKVLQLEKATRQAYDIMKTREQHQQMQIKSYEKEIKKLMKELNKIKINGQYQPQQWKQVKTKFMQETEDYKNQWNKIFRKSQDQIIDLKYYNRIAQESLKTYENEIQNMSNKLCQLHKYVETVEKKYEEEKEKCTLLTDQLKKERERTIYEDRKSRRRKN